jgi:protein-tyrosine-phosphatase
MPESNNTVQSDPALAGRRRFRWTLAQSTKDRIRNLIPRSLLNELRLYQSCKDVGLTIYIRSRTSFALGLPRRPPRHLRPDSVLFVCFGNIMRSPMCEQLMQRAVRSAALPISISSAGLNAVTGIEAHPWAIAAAREFGISLENHRAKLLTSEMVDNAELIFAMDFQNYAQLVSRFHCSRKKIVMLGAYGTSDSGSIDIPDPYCDGPEGTSRCYKTLAACIDNLLQDLVTRGR